MKPTSRRSRLTVLLASLLLLGGAAVWWVSASRDAERRWGLKVVGTLSSQDVAGIRRLVRHEMWRDVRPGFSWSGIKLLPVVIRSRLPERIFAIIVKPDGTVEVETYIEQKVQGVVMFSYGWTYRLQKGPGGWQIIERGDWIS